MTALVMLGGALGAAVFVLICLIRPPRTSSLAALARFDALTSAGDAVGTQPVTTNPKALSRIGTLIISLTGRLGVQYTTLRQDLALAGRTLEQLMARKVVYACAGFVASATVIAAIEIGLGVGLPAPAVAVTATIVAAVCFLLPDEHARTVGRQRRRDFRRAVGAYLDLASLEMAGMAAPAEALPSAAKVGDGWPLAAIRDTLYQAKRTRRSPWEALADLGARTGVTELRDLGHLVTLVAHDGARVRETLTARAATMRRRDLADLIERAGKQDSSMQVAELLIALGFIIFIGYPAVPAILAF